MLCGDDGDSYERGIKKNFGKCVDNLKNCS